MGSFDVAVSAVFEHEQGYSDHPLDAGGPTNFGITIATYSAYLKRTATIPEMIGMPKEAARSIYRASYWGVIQGDSIDSDALAVNLMDMAVLRGVVAAIKTMQSIVGTTPDGLMGTKTMAAINAQDPGVLIIKYYSASIRALASLVVSSPVKVVFLNGWIARVNDMLNPITVAIRNQSASKLSQSKLSSQGPTQCS